MHDQFSDPVIWWFIYERLAQIDVDDEDNICSRGSSVSQVPNDGGADTSDDDESDIEKSVPFSSLAWEAYELSSDWNKLLKGMVFIILLKGTFQLLYWKVFIILLKGIHYIIEKHSLHYWKVLW